MEVSKFEGVLGFRNIVVFHSAILAKQGWRLLTNPSSLATAVLRDKYFKNGKFLEANFGFNPSFIWRSIWRARNLLKMGLIWRVGNENSINIWDDKWLALSLLFN